MNLLVAYVAAGLVIALVLFLVVMSLIVDARV